MKLLTLFRIISHLHFLGSFFLSLVNSSGTSEVKLSHRAGPLKHVGPHCLAQGHFSRSSRCSSALHLSALIPPPCCLHSFPPALWPSLAPWDVCQLFSTPQLFSQLSCVAAGHQFVDKSPFLNSTSRSISQAGNALKNDWWLRLLGGVCHYLLWEYIPSVIDIL